MPANPERCAGILDRFLADVAAGAVVDLLVRPLVDAEREQQPAAGLESAAHHSIALKLQLLSHAGDVAYGIRTDFQTQAFPGSARLLELAHSLEELKTICRCGRKALFNARLVGGRFVFDGDQVAIDELNADRVTYESLCAEDYLRASGGRLQ